jgi:molybdenum cofactor cytidylyltransferase
VAKRSDPGRVTAVILAAGSSTRMGKPKQLLDWESRPLVRHIAETALASVVDGVAVVTGANGDEINGALEGLSVQPVFNPDYRFGQSTSLRAGLAALDPETSAVVFLLVDQPTVVPSSIDAVVGIWRATGSPIVQARYGSTPSHPVLFTRPLFAELQRVQGDEGARSILAAHRDEIAFADLPGPTPFDIDTEDDYRAALATGSTLTD